MLAGLGAAMGTLACRPTAAWADKKNRKKGNNVKRYERADFYDADGKFLVAKAGDAYFEMLRGMNYPVTPAVKQNAWIADFGLGDFPNAGMGGVIWINRPDYCYFGLDIFLLPGQMIPEHSHVATDKGKAKMESWQVRAGNVVTFGEGEPTPKYLDLIPESQRASAKSKHGEPLALHGVAHLNRIDAWHFMVAGPEGAWVTEYGMFQDGAGLRFTNPKAKA
jgi:hypothetical protein